MTTTTTISEAIAWISFKFEALVVLSHTSGR